MGDSQLQLEFHANALTIFVVGASGDLAKKKVTGVLNTIPMDLN